MALASVAKRGVPATLAKGRGVYVRACSLLIWYITDAISLQCVAPGV